MSALALLIPLSILIVAGACIVLLWAIKDGQYDGLDNRMPDPPGDRESVQAKPAPANPTPVKPTKPNHGEQ